MTMQKIFHFDSSPAPYVADAAVLCCFDHRMQLVTRKFLKRNGVAQPDWIVVAGGAKTLASPRNDFEQEFILEQIRMSIKLHRTQLVILTCHSGLFPNSTLTNLTGQDENSSIIFYKVK